MEGAQYGPLPLSGSGDLTQNWQEWKVNFIKYLTVNDYIKISEDLKIHKLKEKIGPLGIYFIDTISKDYNEKELNSLENLLAKLDIAFKVPPSEVEARYNFFTSSRGKNEFINKYIDRLKEKAKTCNFGDLADSLIRDKVIADIKDKDLLLKLFKLQSLDLHKLFKTCRDYEMQKKNNKEKVDKAGNAEIAENSEKAENAGKDSKRNINTEKAKIDNKAEKAENTDKANKAEKEFKRNINAEKAKIDNNTDGTDINKPASQTNQTKPINFTRNCWRCNQRHPIKCCPAFGYKCEKCGERSHFTNCCRMRISNSEEKKPSFEIPSNPRGAHNVSLNTLSNMSPTAPPAFEVENILYPNLNYVESSERQMQPSSSRSQPCRKVTETLQKSQAPLPNLKKSHDKKQYPKATPVDDSGCKMS